MNNFERAKKLFSLFSSCVNYSFQSGDTLIFQFNERDKVESELQEYDIIVEKTGKDKLSINLFDFDFKVYFDRNNFLQHCSVETFKFDICILLFDANDFLFCNGNNREIYLSDIKTVTEPFIENTYYYLQFFLELKSAEIFTYFNSANRELVLISSDKGKFIIGYPITIPDFGSTESLKEQYETYIKRNKSKEFQVFFKEQIIDTLTQFNKQDRFPELLRQVELILEASERNYEIFLNKFSFEELKENFRKERDEYFSTIREIINQLLNKVVSIPISISASAFALYKLKDDIVYAQIVVFAFVVYSVFTSYLIRLIKKDTSEIENDLENDLNIIRQSSNIPKTIIDEETGKVKSKISRLYNTITILQFILILLTMIILVVSFQMIQLSFYWYSILLIFIVISQLLVAFFKA